MPLFLSLHQNLTFQKVYLFYYTHIILQMEIM